MRKQLTLLLSFIVLTSSVILAQTNGKVSHNVINTESVGNPILDLDKNFKHLAQRSGSDSAEVFPLDQTLVYDAQGNPLVAWNVQENSIVDGVTANNWEKSNIYFYSAATGVKTAVSNAGNAVGRSSRYTGRWNVDDPVLGVGADGKIYIAFTTTSPVLADTSASGLPFCRVWFVQSTDGGNTWSAPFLIGGGSNTDYQYISVSRNNPAGEAHFAYFRRANSAGTVIQTAAQTPGTDTCFIEYVRVNTSGATPTVALRSLTGITTLTYDYLQNGGENRIIHLDETGGIHVVFVTRFGTVAAPGQRNIGYAFSDNNGTSWTSSSAISAAAAGFPYIAGTLEDGELVVLYHGARATVAIDGAQGLASFSEFVLPVVGGEGHIWPKGAVSPDRSKVNFLASVSGGSTALRQFQFNLKTTSFDTSNAPIELGVATNAGYHAFASAATAKTSYLYSDFGEFIKWVESTDNGVTFSTTPVTIVTATIGKLSAKLNSPNASSFKLAQNYPNPFNPTTNISYSLNQRSDVVLKVYDVLGREVAVLVNGAQSQGAYTATFNAGNLSSGVYFYRLQAGTFVETKKMLLVK